MKKKTVLAMLVMCMVFSASACSDKSAEKSAPEKTESSAEKTDKAEEKTETKEDTKQEEEKQRSDLCLSAIFPNISP